MRKEDREELARELAGLAFVVERLLRSYSREDVSDVVAGLCDQMSETDREALRVVGVVA